jgi:hypothetical protein
MDDGTEQAELPHVEGGADASPSTEQVEGLVTVRLNPSVHRMNDFVCSRSGRIGGFFRDECPRFLEKNYCRVFVLPDPADPTHIWGFYTLSPGLVEKGRVSTQDQKRAMSGLPIPMILIGFLGRDDSAPQELKLGAVLIHDAALRIHRSEDITAWGLYLDPENDGLVKWYASLGFKSTKALSVEPAPITTNADGQALQPRPLAMYAPLRILL